MTLRAHLRHEAPALAALLLLAVVQLWPAVGPERLPESLDLMLQYVPNAGFLQRSLRGGAVPLWNPYLGAGMPFAADPGAGAWYLPSWPLLLALPLFSAVRAGLWLHLLWAALGTYAFCRLSLGVGRLASLVGAVAFALTTWLPGLAGMPAVLTSVAWLPWIVVLGDVATRRGGRWRAALSLAGALQLLAGWPAGAYLSWLTLGLLLVLRRPLPLAASRAAPAGLAAALLAGVLLVPAFELIGESTYAETRSVEAAGREAYLTLLSWLRPASGSGALESSQLYVGIGAIVLALVGALARDRTARAMMLVAALAFLVAMGTRTPLFGALYAWLPGFRVVYLPARLGIVAAFGLAGLAALGLQRVASGAVTGRQLALVTGGALALVPLTLLQFWLSEGYDSFRRLLTNVGRVTGGPYLSVAQELQYLVFGVCALGALALSRTAARRAAAPALAALLTADALLAHQSARPPAFDPTRWYAPAFDTAERLRAALGSERVVGAQWHGTSHFLTDFPRSAAAGQLPPNLALLVGLRDAQGYNPLLLRRAAQYYARLNAGETGGAPPDDHWLWIQDFAGPGLDALAASTVIAGDDGWRVRSRRFVAPTQVVGGTGVSAALSPPPAGPARIHVVSFLGEAVRVAQGQAVGELRVTTSAGVERHPLRAGVETAEWAYGRPDVRQSIAHRQAPVALRTQLVDVAEGRYAVYEYHATFGLPADTVAVEVVSLVPPTSPTTLNLSGIWLEIPGEYVTSEGGALRHTSALPRLRAAGGPARIVRETSGRVETVVESARGTRVTLADVVYPGWVARIDGEPQPIEPEEGLFRSVDAPAGRHTLVLSYEPLSLAFGAVLSTLGAAAAAALAWPWSRRVTTSSRVRRNTSLPKRFARSAARWLSR